MLCAPHDGTDCHNMKIVECCVDTAKLSAYISQKVILCNIQRNNFNGHECVLHGWQTGRSHVKLDKIEGMFLFNQKIYLSRNKRNRRSKKCVVYQDYILDLSHSPHFLIFLYYYLIFIFLFLYLFIFFIRLSEMAKQYV